MGGRGGKGYSTNNGTKNGKGASAPSAGTGGAGGGGSSSGGGKGTGSAGTGGIVGGGGGQGSAGGGSSTPEPNNPQDVAAKREKFNQIALAAKNAHLPSDAKIADERDKMLKPQETRMSVLAADHQAAIKQAIDDAMTDIIDGGEIVHRTKHLGDLLDSGRLKTLFETGYSAGGDSKGERAKVEAAWFGKNAVPPIYAAMEYDGIFSSTSMYGSTKLYLKDSVKDRITVTLGDSLMRSGSVFPGKPGDGRGLYVATNDIKHRIDPTKTRAENKQAALDYIKSQMQNGTFLETQIHDGVLIEDIEKVVFTQLPSPAMTDRLDKLGIPWEMYT